MPFSSTFVAWSTVLPETPKTAPTSSRDVPFAACGTGSIGRGFAPPVLVLSRFFASSAYHFFARASARERVNDDIERLGIEIEQIVEPADLRIAEMIAPLGLLLLLPDVVKGWVKVGGVVGRCTRGFVKFRQLCRFLTN